MKLAMFDMDGTLTDSFALDENCYVRAIEEALSLQNVVTDWDRYPHASSSFCLEEIVRQARGSAPSAAESLAVQSRMLALMDEISREHGRSTAEIPGAADCLRELPHHGYAVAIASGDWELTARHKLESAGVTFDCFPTAFCEVSHVRTEIMLTALERAKAHYRCAEFDSIVYVGDAAWDVRACLELRWPLVGIGTGGQAERLRALGVAEVIGGYRPLAKFLAVLERAEIPRAKAV